MRRLGRPASGGGCYGVAPLAARRQPSGLARWLLRNLCQSGCLALQSTCCRCCRQQKPPSRLSHASGMGFCCEAATSLFCAAECTLPCFLSQGIQALAPGQDQPWSTVQSLAALRTALAGCVRPGATGWLPPLGALVSQWALWAVDAARTPQDAAAEVLGKGHEVPVQFAALLYDSFSGKSAPGRWLTL